MAFRKREVAAAEARKASKEHGGLWYVTEVGLDQYDFENGRSAC